MELAYLYYDGQKTQCSHYSFYGVAHRPGYRKYIWIYNPMWYHVYILDFVSSATLHEIWTRVANTIYIISLKSHKYVSKIHPANTILLKNIYWQICFKGPSLNIDK